MLLAVHNYYLLALLLIHSLRTLICLCKYLYMLSATFHDLCSVADDPDLSIALTRSTATFRSPEIIFIICRNCYTSRGDPDSSFPLWFWYHSYYADVPEQCHYSRLHFKSRCVWLSSWMLKSIFNEWTISISIYTNDIFRFCEKDFAHFQCKILTINDRLMLIKILSSNVPCGSYSEWNYLA